VVNGPLRVTNQYSQGGTASDPNFNFQPTTASGDPEPSQLGVAQHDTDFGGFGKITSKSGNRDHLRSDLHSDRSNSQGRN
jgi:hypothetical protein